jgi:hypothetical protein
VGTHNSTNTHSSLPHTARVQHTHAYTLRPGKLRMGVVHLAVELLLLLLQRLVLPWGQRRLCRRHGTTTSQRHRERNQSCNLDFMNLNHVRFTVRFGKEGWTVEQADKWCHPRPVIQRRVHSGSCASSGYSEWSETSGQAQWREGDGDGGTTRSRTAV